MKTSKILDYSLVELVLVALIIQVNQDKKKMVEQEYLLFRNPGPSIYKAGTQGKANFLVVSCTSVHTNNKMESLLIIIILLYI